MPTVSIRVSDELKSRLDTLAQESESTLSGVIVEALNSITGLGREDYPEETAPYTINNANRLILRNTELLLAHCQDLDEDERKSHAKNATILEEGFTGEYRHAFAALRPEIPSARCDELFDILDMFCVLRASYDKLPDDEKAEVEERDISFRGFDYSDDEETALPGYVEYLFADDRYTELAVPLSRFSDDGNSHHRNLDIYRRMLHCFNQLWRKHIISFDLLSLDEIKQVVSAPTTPATRRRSKWQATPIWLRQKQRTRGRCSA